MAEKEKATGLGSQKEINQLNYTFGMLESQDQISGFDGISTNPTRFLNWHEAIKEVRNGKYRDRIKRARQILANEGQSAYKEYKKGLPGVSFGGMFSYRKNDKLLSPTGFFIVDIDHVPDVKRVIDIISGDENIWFWFISPGGDGIKVGLRAINIKTDADHKRFFAAVKRYFKEVYNLNIDSACKDISRLTFLSHDPDAFINPNPTFFNIEAWIKDSPIINTSEFPTADTSNVTGKQKYALKVLESACQKIRESTPGAMHYTRLTMARLVGGYLHYIDETTAMTELEKAVATSPTTNFEAAIKTIKDGLENGKQSPFKIPDVATKNNPFSSTDSSVTSSEDLARQIFPRKPFPWEVFPEGIKRSLQALARSCATDATPLPGTAFALVGAALGRKISISPKIGWTEPVIVWPVDIRESGEGKTPPMWAMTGVLKRKQKDSHEQHELEMADWKSKPPKERGDPPTPARGYFATDLTLEGLRVDMENHPTGGLVCLLNEVSALINAQNQYKNKGTDREAWLALHDGQPARVIRASKTYYITGARVQVVGGIQPSIFQKVFGGDDGQYLSDGTVFRCLFTYSAACHRELTSEGWSNENRQVWENILEQAYHWADQAEPKTIVLSEEAQEIFFGWRNDLDKMKTQLPKEVRGFLPKAYGNALRLAAVIDCIHRFNAGEKPRVIIDAEGLERGIKTVMFYLGQAVDAVKLLGGQELEVDQTQAKILKALENGPMSKSQIYTEVFQKHLSSKKISDALDKLKESGQVVKTDKPTKGRSVELYALNAQLNAHGESQSQGLFTLNALNTQRYISKNQETTDEIII